jgi:cyclopropane-fatty-acyl-phospholipid synthase
MGKAYKRVPGATRPPRLSTLQAKSNKADRWLLRRLMDFIGQPPLSLVLWDGSSVAPQGAAVIANIFIHDRGALRKLVSNPAFEFGEMYSSGRIDVDGDLAECLAVIYRALREAGHTGDLRDLLLKGFAKHPHSDQAKARENIHHHYDIGNDFYRLWLDEQLVYTCAYFTAPDITLEQAQTAKLEYVCRKLQLTPGQRVVEAGCGWGALALHMARHYGVTVKAYNLSSEQIAFARQRARREQLDECVEFIEDDGRNIEGEFDAFVSVGMLEHIGVDGYSALGDVIERVLSDDGRGLIHCIGRDRPGPLNSWIQRRIFPGAYPPSISEMMVLFEPNGFSVLDIENLRLHYARTLQHWLQRYEEHSAQVEELFDDTFVRLWRLYLAGSLAAFNTGTLQLFQVLFNRSGNNAVPWTRDYLYREPLLDHPPGQN